MTARTPPSWLQGGSHTAENDRNLTAVFVNAGGVLTATDMAVTAPGGTMTVSVAAGAAFIKGSRAFQGVYHAFNDAAVTLTIAASDPTNARYDRIVAEIKDAAYSGATNAFQINVVQGTPAASPAEPTIPADSIELARITVPAAAGSINSGNILDRRVQVDTTFASRSQGLAANVPAAGRKGHQFYKTDSDMISLDDGTTRHDFPSKAVTDAAYVARVLGSGDSFAATGLTGSTAASRYVGATASGAPASGAHLLGDFVIDQTGKVWICTTAGTPGTWTQIGGSTAHCAQVTKAAASTAFTSATWTHPAFDAEDIDTDGFHDNVTNNSRITIPAGLGGKWRVRTQILFGGQATGNLCHVGIGKNGAAAAASTILGHSEASAQGSTLSVTGETILTLAAGDYVEAWMYSLATSPTYMGDLTEQSTSHLSATFLGT